MIIFHNPHDKLSRDFVANHGEGNLVIDWYSNSKVAEKYKTEYGPLFAHRFPCVLIFVPEYEEDAYIDPDGDEITPRTIVPAGS